MKSSKKNSEDQVIKKADILFVPIIFSNISKKFKHSMLSSNNKTKILRLDDKNKLIFKETLHCNARSRTTKSSCSKFYLYLDGMYNLNKEIILLKPDYLAIRKLIPKLKKTKLQNCVIKEMRNFVNNPNIKLMNKSDITRIFKKCQIPKSKLLSKKVNFDKRKN